MSVKCYLCQSADINNVEYGEIMQLKNISVHYFCLVCQIFFCLLKNT